MGSLDPASQMTDYHTLVQVETVAEHLGDTSWALIDCGFDLADPDAGERAYRKAHIPGAHYAHLDLDLAGPVTPTSGRHPLPHPDALAARFSAWGIDGRSQLIAYDAAGKEVGRGFDILDNKATVNVPLQSGDNTVGFHVEALDGIARRYVGFDWIRIHREEGIDDLPLQEYGEGARSGER